MDNTNGSVWVIAEQRDCRIRTVSLQLMGQARRLAHELGTRAEAVLLGDRIKDHLQPLSAAGASRIYLGESPEAALYEPEVYLETIVSLAGECRPQIILIGSTSMGRELAPLVAAKLKTGLTAHCIDLVLDENGILENRIPAYGGMLSIICPQKRPQMATVAKGVFATPEPDDTHAAEIVPITTTAGQTRRIQTLEVVRNVPDQVPLDDAETVVAGGAGVGDADGWQLAVNLAKVLNAGLGCTRPAVDEGWAPLDSMIGQSGRMVSPQLYIGVGLSGEQQHMVGITDAKLMVAINNDPHSPVFEQVDLGVVEDCREFLPLLIEKLEAYREQQVTC